jgi:hypothetical protein
MSRFVRTGLTLLGLVGALGAEDRQVAPKQIPVYGDGDVYLSACLPKEAARLEQEITKLAGLRNPAGAWALAKAMLCGNDAAGDRLVLAHMPASLQSTDEGPDGTYRARLPRSASLRRQGWAFGANSSANPDGDIEVSFQIDEASVGSFILRFRGKEWLVVVLGSGSC